MDGIVRKQRFLYRGRDCHGGIVSAVTCGMYLPQKQKMADWSAVCAVRSVVSGHDDERAVKGKELNQQLRHGDVEEADAGYQAEFAG